VGSSEDSATRTTTKDADVEEAIEDMIEWLLQKGGFFHPSLEIKYTLKPEDEQFQPDGNGFPSYKFGLFVKPNETIKEGEEILYFPKLSILYPWQPEDDRFDENVACGLALNLADKLDLLLEHGHSEYAPFLTFLHNYVLDKVNLPFTWSKSGRAMLESIVGTEAFPSFERFGFSSCIPLTEYLQDQDNWDGMLEASVSGRRDRALVPIYSLIGHTRDSEKNNIEDTGVISTGRGFGVKTTRALLPGEEILHSYAKNRPVFDAELDLTMDYRYGTHEVFRDHGFVEPYPQRWHSKQYRLDYFIHQDQGGQLKLEWLSDERPDDECLDALESDLKFYKDMLVQLSSSGFEEVPSDERRLMKDYLSAYAIALEMVVSFSTLTNESKYIVHEEKKLIDNADMKMFQDYQCNHLLLRVLDNNEFEMVDELKSAYQEIDYYVDPDTGDNCLFLDDVPQQCMVSLRVSILGWFGSKFHFLFLPLTSHFILM
jgi:hypothetical protein